MPPLRRSRSPAHTPLDPFPPLRRVSSNTNTPSYATVARAARAGAEPVPFPARWDAEDVDRHEALDDLWAASRPDQTGRDPREDDDDDRHSTFSPPRPALAGGADEPGSGDLDDDGELAPRSNIFTLEELLGIARQPGRAARAAAADAALAREERTSYLPPWHGGLDAAQRAGYAPSPYLAAPEAGPARHYEWLSYPSRRVGLGRDSGGGAAPGVGAAVADPAPAAAGDAAAPRMGMTTLRRRWRDSIRNTDGTHRQAYVFDVDDIAPPGAAGGDDPFWSRLGDHESDDEEEYAGWRVAGLYNHPNDALGADDDASRGAAEGGSWAMRAAGIDVPARAADLHRGGFNRRRLRMTASSRSLRSLAAQQELDAAAGRTPAPDAERAARTPTNLGSAPEPVVVRSTAAGARRRRSLSADEAEADRPAKRSRVSVPPPQLPSYLDHAGLPLSAFPSTFVTPPARSHLSLTHVHRPIIEFTTSLRPTGTDDDACALRTSTAIPTVGIYYFEVEVLSAGERGFLSLGFMKNTVSLNRLVGWEKGSWGWHGDDGRSFGGQGTGEPFAEQWGAGDIVGAGLDYTSGRAFFTKNGKLMGYRFSALPTGLHPAVGLRTPGESLAVNLTGPFVYDIDGHACAARATALRLLRDTPVSRVPLLTDPETGAAGVASVELGQATAPTVAAAESRKPSAPAMPLALTSGSPLHTPIARTEAAFVLDHLAAKGFRASAMLRSAMAARSWVEAPSASAAGAVAADPAADSATAPTIDPDLVDLSSALVRLRAACSQPHAATPWDVLDRVDPGRTSTSGAHAALGQRHAIYDYVGTLRRAAVVPQTDAKEVEHDAVAIDDAVLGAGRDLLRRERAETWAAPERALLGTAMGLLSEPDVGAWPDFEARRLADVELLVDNVRVVLGLAPRTHLEHAAAQTGLVLRTLAARGVGAAALVSVDDCLHVPRRANGSATA